MSATIRSEQVTDRDVSDVVTAGARTWALPLGGCWTSRPARVVMALGVVVALSIVDLDLTLVFASQTGMIEGNPIARALMREGSALGVVLWKVATVAVAIALLYRARQTRTGELGAWLCVAVLTWLTCHWMTFSREASAMPSVMSSPWLTADASYVRLDSTP